MFLCLCLGLLLAACGGNTRKESSVADAQEEVAVSDGVEVLYFHGKQPCATSIAIAVCRETQRRGGDRREPDGICFRQCPQVAGSVQGWSGEDRS